MPGQQFVQMQIKFFSAVHLRLKPLSVSHLCFPLSASKLTCSFPLPPKQNKINLLIPDIWLMLVK